MAGIAIYDKTFKDFFCIRTKWQMALKPGIHQLGHNVLSNLLSDYPTFAP